MERRSRSPYMPTETDIPSINPQRIADAAAAKVQQERIKQDQINAKLAEASVIIDARTDDPVLRDAMKIAAQAELADRITPRVDPYGRRERLVTRESLNSETEHIKRTLLEDLESSAKYLAATDEEKEEMRLGIASEAHEHAVARSLRDSAGQPVNLEELKKHLEKTDRSKYQDFDEQALDDARYEVVKVPSQMGGEIKYYWPKSPEGKIELMRQIMNEVEENYTQDFGTSQTAIQELYAVIPIFQKSARPDLNEVGDLMFSEFRWRYTFQQAYTSFAFATEANKVIESTASLGNSLLNFYKRNSHDAYAASSLQNCELPIMTVYRWVDKNIEDILRLPESEHDDYIEAQLTHYFRNILKKGKTTLSDTTLKSAIINGRRIWEVERLGKKDALIHRETRKKFDIYAKDDATRQQAWADLHVAAKENKVEWLGKLENKRLARETYSTNLHMYVQAWGLQIKTYRFDGFQMFDANNRDMMSTMPGDFYEMLEAKLKNHYSKDTGEISSSVGNKAVAEAIKLTESILGVKAKLDDKGRPKWPGRTSAEPIDITKWAHSLSEFDNLVEEGFISTEEKQSRINTILEVIGPEAKIDNNKIVAINPDTVSERTKFLLELFKYGLFGYDQPESNYGNKSQRYIGGAKKFYDDNALGGHDCYGRKNLPSIGDGVKMLQALNYMRAGQGDQQKSWH